VAKDLYRVNIVGLSNKVHHFEYDLGDEFLNLYGKDLLTAGSFVVNVALDKHETFLEADISIEGTAQLVCDRSLETFDQPVSTRGRMIFKYGETDEELSDEIVVIHRDTVSLDLGQYFYEFIGLALPMKRLHPRFQDEDTDEDGKIVYSSDPNSGKDEDTNDKPTDPRWDVLKKLK